jgi:hypothetical protein
MQHIDKLAVKNCFRAKICNYQNKRSEEKTFLAKQIEKFTFFLKVVYTVLGVQINTRKKQKTKTTKIFEVTIVNDVD